MNNKVDLQTRIRFRDWLRGELRRLDFYQRRGDHYLIREFAKYCVEHNAPIDEASLGRYLRDEEPVLPTPERCRALARVLEYEPLRVLIEAGYLEGDDMFLPLPKEASAETVAKALLDRRDLIAKAASSVKAIAPLSIIVEQMQLSTGEIVGRMAVGRDASKFLKEIEKGRSGKNPGAAAVVTQIIEEFHEAQKSTVVSTTESAPVVRSQKVKTPN